MPRTGPFQSHSQRYDAWFQKHEAAYLSELLALRPFVPWQGRGIEIGVGSGRFAAPLGVWAGVDPSPAMGKMASARGVALIAGAAEGLPFHPGKFDYALVVTTLCFVDSPARMLREAHRVLKPDGRLVLGFVDRESSIGREYLAGQTESVFYREATFYSVHDVRQLLSKSGFVVDACGQTLSRPLNEMHEIEPLRSGHGVGAFVVISALKDRGIRESRGEL